MPIIVPWFTTAPFICINCPGRKEPTFGPLHQSALEAIVLCNEQPLWLQKHIWLLLTPSHCGVDILSRDAAFQAFGGLRLSW